MKKIILLILIGLFPTVMFANNFLFKRNDRNLISSLDNLIELHYIDNRDIQNYDSNLQDIIIFLSDYFTSSDDKKAVRLINYLKRLRILDNYIDGLSNQNDIKDKVLYSFEFFLKKSPNIFEKDFFKEKISANLKIKGNKNYLRKPSFNGKEGFKSKLSQKKCEKIGINWTPKLGFNN